MLPYDRIDPTTRWFRRLFACGFLWLLLLLPIPGAAELNGDHGCPSQYGEIVYQLRPDAPIRLYIIANSHRSATTGANGDTTVQAQIETYRIGAWLLDNHQIDLLLPEGYFGSHDALGTPAVARPHIEDHQLARKLTDNATFVNAELLLRERYGVTMAQVEDRQLYRDTWLLLNAVKSGGTRISPGVIEELESLQARRSVTILQRAPSLLEDALRQYGRQSGGAMLTIGISHLDDILSLLGTGRDASSPTRPDLENGGAPLKPTVGVTVIVPRSLRDYPILAIDDRF